MTNPEQRHILPDQELETNYPGLRRAVSRAAEVTTRHFRPFRKDVDIIKPPLLLCDADLLNPLVNETMRNSRYEQNEQRKFAHFEPLQGVVMGGSQELQAELRKGEKGQQQITFVMAEEYIHAFSTREEADQTRCGYIQLPAARTPHSYEPGKIYQYELPPVAGNREEPFRIPVAQQRLTENVTNLVLHLLAEELLFQPETKYPFIIVTADNQQVRPMVIQKDRQLEDKLIESLVTGNRKQPELIELFNALKIPGIHMASLPTLRPKSVNDFLIF